MRIACAREALASIIIGLESGKLSAVEAAEIAATEMVGLQSIMRRPVQSPDTNFSRYFVTTHAVRARELFNIFNLVISALAAGDQSRAIMNARQSLSGRGRTAA